MIKVGEMRLLVVVTRRTRRLASCWVTHLKKMPLESLDMILGRQTLTI